MMDDLVLGAQRFINSYNVSDIPKIKENGRTSWEVMYALTRILQYELGIATLSDSFGPTTLSTLQSKYPVVDRNSGTEAINRIIRSGLVCKGYDGGEILGTFDEKVSTAVTKLKQDMGVAGVYPGEGVTPKVFKALLTMDPYVVVLNGSEQIRSIQQWMNSQYVGRREFFIIPCDGWFSRDVQKALMLAIQYEIGMSDDVANGVFGPGTQKGIKNNVLAVGSGGTWVQLFSAAMIFNRRINTAFTKSFDSRLSAEASSFQDFVKLPVTGKGDFQTWASLLVSTGDDSRRGAACDCVTTITPARAQSLKDNGYQIIGRYLSNVPSGKLNKMIQPGELKTITDAGLRVFPIYQTVGSEAAYFNYSQGRADAFAAIERARYYGFKPRTRIYFAVDFDALDYQVTDSIIPHFSGIKDTMVAYAQEYEVGVYGPRNVCTRVSGLASASFVSDMSTGFSGNLGYPMPLNWAFDQIATITVGAGDGLIEIDNNITSGRDNGQNSFNPGQNIDNLDVGFDMALHGNLLKDTQTYFESIAVPETGGDGTEGGTYFYNTTTDALKKVLQHDALITQMSRVLGIRKAYIQCPLLWEIRKFNLDDPIADAAVRQYHTSGGGLKNDSSTGLGQIFAATAINARNYCIDLGLILGAKMDSTKDADIWAVWQRLNGDEEYNVQAVAMAMLDASRMANGNRPGLNDPQESIRKMFSRYNGTGPKAEKYGFDMFGEFKVFEKYNAPLRSK
ncbi:DUF1906 domain-containing protein [Pseudonocardiaceae bacterium YIM PH 21723]|nr:DUF1906 domain-containing protein [Pseudonocardiaceae bacterium YIM PH 21723]